ncbi:MAG: hypothetical protein K6F59_00745, partial [Gammaproteobacteria bacterium]|nr:hypothetical protein [Gammaproteobacteria bacterium]
MIYDANHVVNTDEILSTILNNRFLIPSIIITAICIIAKLVVGIIYGKNGKDNPLKFIFIMKFVNLPMNLFLIVLAIALYLSSSLAMAIACLCL